MLNKLQQYWVLLVCITDDYRAIIECLEVYIGCCECLEVYILGIIECLEV